MRKIVFWVVLILFINGQSQACALDLEKDFFELRSDGDLNIFFSEVDKVATDLYQIMESFHGTENQLINLFQSVSNLTTHLLKRNSQYSYSKPEDKINAQKESEEIYAIFSQLVCDFLSVLELNKIEMSSLSEHLKLEKLSFLQQSKTRETKMIFLKNLIDKKETEKLTEFIQEFSIAFSAYLNKELKVFVNDTQGKLCLYLGYSENELNEPLIFRKHGKKRRFFSALFGAIGNACVSLVNLLSNKDHKNQKESIINLCGTAFNLISDLNSMKNSQDAKKCLTKIEQESVINMTVQTIEDLYAVLKKANIDLDVDKESKKFLMDNLDSFVSAAERRIWIENTLKNRGLSEKLLTAVFKCLKKCLQEMVEKVVEILSEKMMDMMVAYVHSKT